MIPKLQSSINVNFRSKALLADLLSDQLQSCPIMCAMDEETADICKMVC